MEQPMTKSQILADMQSEWLLLEQTLNRLSEEQMLAPGVTGKWSVKDDLAHINAWEKVLIDRMECIMTGQPVKYPPIRNNDDVELFNSRTYLENRERSLSSVQLEFRSLYSGLLTMLEALDEAALTRPIPWDWASDELRLWHIIVANTSDHYREHRLEMEKFFA